MTSEVNGTTIRDLKACIGERFRQMRHYVGLSQKETSAIFGMNQANIARIEKGIVSPNMLICHYFKTHYNIDTNWLISGKGDMVIQEEEKSKTADYGEFTEEMLDLFFYIDYVPEIRLAVLKYFLGYKLENKKQILEFLQHQKVAEG